MEGIFFTLQEFMTYTKGVVYIFMVLALLAAGFLLGPVWSGLTVRIRLVGRWQAAWPWLGLVIAAGLLFLVLPHYPITAWNVAVYSESPGTYSFLADQGQLVLPASRPFTGLPPVVVLGGVLLSGLLGGQSLQGGSSLGSGAAGLPLRR